VLLARAPGRRWSGLLLALLVVPLVFVLATPYAVLDFRTFWDTGIGKQTVKQTRTSGRTV
jgi:hypothetical protein